MFNETQNYGMPKKHFSIMQCYHRDNVKLFGTNVCDNSIFQCFWPGQLPVYAKCKNCNQKHTLLCDLLTKLHRDNFKHEIQNLSLKKNGSSDFHRRSVLQKTNATTYHKHCKLCQHVTVQEQVTKCKSVNTQHCHNSS